jgi:phage-related protein
VGGTTSLVFNFLRGRDTVSGHMATIGNRAQTMAAKLRSSSRITSLVIGALVAILAGLVAEIVAFTSATAPMVGALGALPAVAFAAAAGLAALLVGFRGLGAALKKYSSSAGQSAEATAAAEHRLVVAQRAALQAQEDLNEARKTAAERLADVTRELARAHLDERAAILAVKDAQNELRSARSSGDRTAVQRAQIGYEESVLSLEEIRARLKDVTQEEAKRAAAGVEGSDEVKAALERQADAVYELAQAQRNLTSGAGGADKAAQAYAKLTAQGKALVDVLHAIAPAWRRVQQATQAAMLDRVAEDLKAISGAYLPVMAVQLPALASGWNNMFRSMSRVAVQADFVNDMNGSLGRSATLWQRVGNAFGPFLSGFRHWVVIGSAFMPRMGSWTQKQAAAFDRWSGSVRETGKAHAWIERALVVGHEFWVLLKNLGGATVALFSAGSAGPGYLKTLSDGAAALRDFLNTDEGKAKAANLFTSLRDIWSAAWAAFKQLLDLLAQADLSGVVGVFTVMGAVFAFLARHMDIVNKLLPILIPAFVAFKVAILAVRAATAIWAIATGIATAAQWLWNVAMYANPIGLIILAIVAFVAVIVLLWTHSEGFRNFFISMWDEIWSFLKMIGHWFAHDFVDFFVKAWEVIKTAFKWQTIVDGFKWAVNQLIRGWNALDFGIHLHLPSWAGGYGFDVDDVVPDIPYLATGGRVKESGLAVIHRGETVTPAAQVAPLSGGRVDVVQLVAPPGDVMAEMFLEGMRKIVRRRGGNVQFVVGKG